ncbi:MAG: cell division protein ZapA [Eubacteriales bacterium]|nr:cell division protein ZapA [Eubacteriales bacterium]
MSAKNQTQVLINGQIFMISGYESEEYIQRVASYLSGKLSELQRADSYRRLTKEKQNMVALLNIADDYFKAKKQVETLEDNVTYRDKEIFELKHQLMDLQRQNEELKKK